MKEQDDLATDAAELAPRAADAAIDTLPDPQLATETAGGWMAGTMERIPRMNRETK